MDALTALKNIAAAQTDGHRSASVHRFLNDRIDYYTSKGLDRGRAVELAYEDRRAQY